MKLISSAETISFLAAAAPKPWIKRMLLWMIFEGDLSPYFIAGMIKVTGRVIDILHQLPDEIFQSLPRQNFSVSVEKTPILEQALLKKFDPSVPEKIFGKNGMEYIDDDPVIWDSSNDPHKVGAGFFVYSSEIDWDAGNLISDFVPEDFEDDKHLFWDADDHLVSALFEKPDFSIFLSGMCFELNAIEMLLPTAQVALNSSAVLTRGEQNRQLGRPRKWDWDAAFAHIVALANRPDGLPTGPGAQARIEELLSQWFIDQTGDAPSTSQIRTRAQTIVRSMG